MGLFRRKKTGGKSCPECRSYAMVEGYGYCAKEIVDKVNIRLLSGDAIKRQCNRCPDEMTCDDWSPK